MWCKKARLLVTATLLKLCAATGLPALQQLDQALKVPAAMDSKDDAAACWQQGPLLAILQVQ